MLNVTVPERLENFASSREHSSSIQCVWLLQKRRNTLKNLKTLRWYSNYIVELQNKCTWNKSQTVENERQKEPAWAGMRADGFFPTPTTETDMERAASAKPTHGSLTTSHNTLSRTRFQNDVDAAKMFCLPVFCCNYVVLHRLVFICMFIAMFSMIDSDWMNVLCIWRLVCNFA